MVDAAKMEELMSDQKTNGTPVPERYIQRLKQISHVGESNRQLAEREREHQTRHNNYNFRLIKIREHFGPGAPEKALSDEAALMRFRDYMNLTNKTEGRMGKKCEPSDAEVKAIGRLFIKAVRRPIHLAPEATFLCDFPGCNKCFTSRIHLRDHFHPRRVTQKAPL